MCSDTTEESIRKCLRPLEPEVCKIINFSNQHSRGQDSHFAITLVSSHFTDTSRLQRQQMVNKLLLPLLNNPVHSWTLNLYAPEQWQTKPEARKIPGCRHTA